MNLINRFLWHYWWGQSQYLQQRLDELEAEPSKAELAELSRRLERQRDAAVEALRDILKLHKIVQYYDEVDKARAVLREIEGKA